MINKKIGIIGCGNMGEALLAGMLNKNIVNAKNITISEKQTARSNTLKRKYSKVTFAKNNNDLVKNSSVIILAVKPQDIKIMLSEISALLTSSHLLISIAAGIKISSIEKIVGKKISVIRAMPNLPALIGEGMTAYCISRNTSKKDEKTAEKILESAGEVLKLKEDKLDAVTAISGSGPAYIFYMLEAMAQAGVKSGLTKEQSKTLSVKTMLGAAKMIEKGECPAVLREKVTSPKGTTEAALKVLFKKKWKETLIEAIKQAEKRSKELSR